MLYHSPVSGIPGVNASRQTPRTRIYYHGTARPLDPTSILSQGDGLYNACSTAAPYSRWRSCSAPRNSCYPSISVIRVFLTRWHSSLISHICSSCRASHADPFQENPLVEPGLIHFLSTPVAVFVHKQYERKSYWSDPTSVWYFEWHVSCHPRSQGRCGNLPACSSS